MLYELSDQVRQNIIAILNKATMIGEQWRVFAEIEQALNNPVQAVKPAEPAPKPPPAPENETTTQGKPPKPKP